MPRDSRPSELKEYERKVLSAEERVARNRAAAVWRNSRGYRARGGAAEADGGGHRAARCAGEFRADCGGAKLLAAEFTEVARRMLRQVRRPGARIAARC